MQLEDVKEKYYGVGYKKTPEGYIKGIGGIKDTWQAGPYQGTASRVLSIGEAGDNFDKSVDAMRDTITGITKVPGIGSMSDFETKLQQAKMPDRVNFESSIEDQIKYLEQIADFFERGYSDMLTPDGNEEPVNEESYEDRRARILGVGG